MRLSVSLLCALGFAISGGNGLAASDGAMRAVDRGLAAMGGAKALGAVKTIALRAKVRHWEPEQSLAPGGEMRLAGDSALELTRDLGAGAARSAWVRQLVYPGKREYRFSEIIAGDIGYVEGVDSTARTRQAQNANPPAHAMSGLRVATAKRELRRTSPRLLLEMKANPGKVAALPAQEVDGRRHAAVRYAAPEDRFIVMFDPDTGLPARIRTRDTDNVHGDSDFDLVLSDWREVGGVLLPHRQAYALNGAEVMLTEVEQAQINPAIDAGQFAIPEAIRAGAPRAARGGVPWQWVLRRQYIGVYLDSDKVNRDPETAELTFAELAPGVSQVRGGSHNALVVEMDTFLVVVDAPIDEAQSLWTLEAAAKKYPGKPVRYLMLSHHHMDHVGGARTYAAVGAKLVVPQGSGGHFRRMLSAPHAIDKDLLQQRPRKTEVIEVEDRLAISDGRREVLALATPNPHSELALIAYIPDARLGFVTDLWSPGRDKLGAKATGGQMAVVAAVKRHGIAPERFAGGHGSEGSYPELAALAEKN